ncbi:MAG TPA: DUF1326 domain-containing protein [Verrucomicrobiae bacterium]|nr:DUF1326 domain-containing protein [Verrucomicrobiae bacterium]
MASGTKWKFEADFWQACNCDYGCPCEFEAPPSKGFCQGLGVWRISKGSYGKVSLDGLSLGFAIHTPEALHKGNGTGMIFYDKKANAAQRDALKQIGEGKAGGLPFEIFPAIISKLLEPQYVDFQYKSKGRNSSVRAGDLVQIALEPIKNPVSGKPESIRVEHTTGFMFKTAEVLSAKECRSTAPGLSFNWPDKSGFLSHVQYAN